MSNKPFIDNCRRRRCLRASCSTRVILCCAPECIPLRQRHTCAGAVRIPCALSSCFPTAWRITSCATPSPRILIPIAAAQSRLPILSPRICGSCFASCGRNAEYQRYTVLLCPLPDGGYCQYFGSFHGCYERSADYGNARRWRPSDNGGCAVEQYISQRCKVRLLQVIDQFYAQINAQEEAPQERPEEMQN